MGAGYNIPISFSAASTVSLPTSFNSPTVFNFNSPGASGGPSESQANPYQPATAVSSASNGGPASSALGSGTNSVGSTGSASKLPIILAVGGLAVWFFLRKKAA